MDSVKVFDAFPKVAPSHTVRSTRGSYSTIMTLIFMTFVFWIEVGGFFEGFVDHQFEVDPYLRETVRINMDIIVAMPCNYIHTNVRDSTSDRLIAAELLNYEGVNFNIPNLYKRSDKKVITPELEKVLRDSMVAEFNTQGVHHNEGAPACRIYGALPVNRVKGDFHITARGFGYRDRSSTPLEQLNFTHLINEFSFGEFYPYMDNPLDIYYKETDQHSHTFQYFMNVVPTAYRKLGVEVDTNQYSLRTTESTNKYVPGIFFKYDFDPIKIVIEERRMSFLRFIVRLVSIIGGVLTVIQWLYKGTDKLIAAVFGKEVARRGEEKPGSLLDKLDD